MPATPAALGGIVFVSEHSAIPSHIGRPLAANAQVGKGQFVTVSLATGYASLNDGTVPNQVAAGNGDYSDFTDTPNPTAGSAGVRCNQRWVYGLPASALSNDGFTDADFGVPFYIKDENTPGKLSNVGGVNRSLGGMVFGLASLYGSTTPMLWTGPVAHALARATLVTNALLGGFASHILDATAGTTTAEKAMVRFPVHGVITAVEYQSMGSLAANNTDYVTINVYKADGLGGTHVLVASFDSRAANQNGMAAGVTEAFALSAVAGALNLLETDILTYEVLKAGAGQVVPVGTLRVVQKAI